MLFARRLILSALGFLITAGCCSARCGTGEALLVNVVHISGGDGPLMTSLSVYDKGSVALEYLGQRKLCSSIEAKTIAAIRSTLESRQFHDLASNLAANPAFNAPADWAQVVVQFHQQEFRVALEKEPKSLVPFLTSIDDAFRKAFRTKYRLSLLAPRGAS